MNAIRLSFIMYTAILLPVFWALNSCTTNGKHSTRVQQDKENYASLLELLREEPQLDIKGSETNANITIRGRKPLLAPSEVLFAIDGILVGSYNDIYTSIDVNTVESIRVLSWSEASVYGPNAGHGVIVLRIKE